MLVLPPIDAQSLSSSPPSETERGELEKLRLFRDSDREAVKRLEKAAVPVSYAREQEIQTPMGTVLVITRGEVSCFIHDAADKKFLLGTAKAGDVVGEMSHLAKGGSDDQKVVLQALTGVEALKLPSNLFFDVVSHDANASMNLMTLLADRLAAMNRFAKQAVDIDIDPLNMQARTLGERMADFISSKIGTWRFLSSSVVFVGVYMGLNSGVFGSGWDRYPFIFLNLFLSFVSAATMPVLLMSQNRQTDLDRKAARTNHIMTLRATQLGGRILKDIRKLLRATQRLDERMARLERGSPRQEKPEGRKP